MKRRIHDEFRLTLVSHLDDHLEGILLLLCTELCDSITGYFEVPGIGLCLCNDEDGDSPHADDLTTFVPAKNRRETFVFVREYLLKRKQATLPCAKNHVSGFKIQANIHGCPVDHAGCIIVVSHQWLENW